MQIAANCQHFVQEGDRARAVQLLLEAGAGADVRRTDLDMNTPLIDTVRRGDVAVAMLLLDHGADPNVSNAAGEAALNILLRVGCEGGFITLSELEMMVQKLLKAGADPRRPDCRGILPVQHALHLPPIERLLRRWSLWWQGRTLAWIRSRGEGPSGAAFNMLLPEVLRNVAGFL